VIGSLAACFLFGAMFTALSSGAAILLAESWFESLRQRREHFDRVKIRKVHRRSLGLPSESFSSDGCNAATLRVRPAYLDAIDTVSHLSLLPTRRAARQDHFPLEEPMSSRNFGVFISQGYSGERHWRRGGCWCFRVTEIGQDHSLGRSNGFRLAGMPTNGRMLQVSNTPEEACG